MEGFKIAVVIPSYKVINHILGVIWGLEKTKES